MLNSRCSAVGYRCPSKSTDIGAKFVNLQGVMKSVALDADQCHSLIICLIAVVERDGLGRLRSLRFGLRYALVDVRYDWY